ncbi:VCBS repeat-containing protein [Streptomyces sp. LX-29]|uniref:FG-GAP repeat domain-containing protein n=1 Tax=Streptomyces sp. LX-29 TaxID=2900152 RepID=UPI00240E2F77|nr:VCBS repeat-containing protein [Streptomyces sp. LX-29]WFB06945.1 VCBS repeat-containing protein [Streptomyces sp. LX-29]
MALSSGRNRGRALARLTTAAIAAALVGTTAGTAMADDNPGPVPAPFKGVQQAAPKAAAASKYAPVLGVYGVTKAGDIYGYHPDKRGGLEGGKVDTGFWKDRVHTIFQVDHDKDRLLDGMYGRYTNGTLAFMHVDKGEKKLGGGWNQYNLLMSPGNLAGTKQSDILARNKSGVLYLYLAKADGSLQTKKRIGGGWDQYTQIAGQHDLTGDGKADIVARDKAGVLWLYKGTGDANKPFAKRAKVGGGWGGYNRLLSSGDVDLDGRTDLIARDKAGNAWLFKGTGKASAPFKAKKKVASGWGKFTLIFS